MEWDEALEILRRKQIGIYKSLPYLSEALEKWPIQYVQELLPRAFIGESL